MIRTNFNRSSCYLFILVSLTATSCVEQSSSHLAINESVTPEIVPPVDQVLIPKEQVELQPASLILKEQPEQQSAVMTESADVSEQPVIQQKTVLRQTSRKEKKQESDTQQDTEESVTTSSVISKSAVARHTKSLWARMFSMYALPDDNNPRVMAEVQNFLKHPKSLIALQRRAEPYLYLILDELEAKKLPGELALLPMIESAFRVNAHSQAEAAGLWQFTPATAVTFGLKQNWWYDGRRDVYASTEAATSYLKKLHKRFDGDWLLALASYNVGAGNVNKAIRKNTEMALDTHFWSLNLPEETKAYVPKLLAIAKIFAHAEEYNLPLYPIPNQPFLKAVNIDSQLDLSMAAELAGMPLDEFFNLNPAFNHAITAPEGSYRILVKAKNAGTFKRKLAKLPKSEHVKWGEHTIKPGEDLDAIAKQHDISVETIIEINQLKDQKLAVGSILRLPPSKSVKALAKA